MRGSHSTSHAIRLNSRYISVSASTSEPAAEPHPRRVLLPGGSDRWESVAGQGRNRALPRRHGTRSSRAHERTNLQRLTLAVGHLRTARLVSGGKIPVADLNLTAVIDGAGYKPERMRTLAQVHWRPSVAAQDSGGVWGRGRAGASESDARASRTKGSEEGDRRNGVPYSRALCRYGIPSVSAR
jgi:hypothetical protein